MADSVTFQELAPTVTAASKQYGVPEEYIWNVIRAENSGSPKGAQSIKAAPTGAVSPKGARGIMQVMPIALEEVKRAGLVSSDVRHDQLTVQDQINVGTAYLSQLMKLSDKPEEIYAMYNYGPKARFRMDKLPSETKGYVEKATGSVSTETSTGGGPTGTFGGGMIGSGDLVQALLLSNQQQNALMASSAQQAQRLQQSAVDMLLQSQLTQGATIQQVQQNAVERATIEHKIGTTAELLQTQLGMDPTAVEGEIAKSLAEADAARKQYKGVRAKYDELASKDLISDPIGFLFSRLQMPSVGAQVNAAVDAEDRAIENLSRRSALLASFKQSITAQTADQMLQLKAKEAEAAANDAKAKLAAASAGTLVQQAGAIMQQMQVANMMADNTRSTISTIATLQDRQESMKDRANARATTQAAKDEAAAEEDRLNTRLKVVATFFGMTEAPTIKTLKSLAAGPERDRWFQVATTGQLGENFHDAITFFQSKKNDMGMRAGGGSGILDAGNRLFGAAKEYLAPVEQQAKMAKLSGGKAKSGKEIQEEAFQLYADTVTAAMGAKTEKNDMSSEKWDKQFNPYKPNFTGFNQAVNVMPQLAGLKSNVLKTTIDDLGTAGTLGDNLTAAQQQQVFKGIAEKVKLRQITPKKAAADIVAYLSAATAYNKSYTQYERFGLPAQQSYMFTVSGETFGPSAVKVDMMNPTAVENWITKRAVDSTVPQYTDPITGLDPSQPYGNYGLAP